MFDEIKKNQFRTVFLVIIFFVLIGLLSIPFGLYLNSIPLALIIVLVFGFIYALIVFNTGDSIILSMSGAKLADRGEHLHLINVVEGLAIAAGIPTPKVYIINDSALNAFATGKNPKTASIAVTSGLLEKLDKRELEGVIAHEMSHIKNYDIKVMMIAAVLVGVIALLSDLFLRSFIFSGGSRRSNNNKGNGQIIIIVIGLVLAILAPFIAQLIKLAISRKREYMADASSVVLTRYPQGLKSALEKISGDPDPLVDNANKAIAPLFISSPFRKKKGYSNLFSTHPPIEERIKRLGEM